MAYPNLLTIMRDGVTVKTLPVEGDVLLGRGEGCAIRLDDRAISRQHALFRLAGNSVQVENKSEFAPLLVNGVECPNALLKEGDVISIGPYFIRVSAPVESPPVASSVKESEPAATPESVLEVPSENPPALEGVDGLPGLGEPGLGGDGVALGMIESPSPEAGVGSPSEIQESLGNENGDIPSNEPSANGSSEGGSLEGAEVIDEDGKTKVGAISKVNVKLVFPEGTANVTEFELNQDEVSIGRGKNCEIILNDKKASRKNSIITRTGLTYTIKDLESANGTFVNGVRIQEQELAGDDLIRIGGVEFQFKAVSADYTANEKGFMSLPVEEEVQEFASPDANAAFATPDGLDPANPAQPSGAVDGLAGGLADAGVGNADVNAIPGITGISGSATPGKKKSLMEKFRALPKRTQIIVIIAVFVIGSWLMEDDEIPIVKKPMAKKKPLPAPTSSVVATAALTFESLSPEKKQFVEAQHNIAFDYYRNKEYDKALFEIEKIFSIIADYKDAREIERYAREGKRKMEALEEERRKKEEEAKLKARIAQLVEETRQAMEKKNYDRAKELFTDVLGIDPDNSNISTWKKEIEDFEEQKRIEEQQKQVQIDINKRAWEIYSEAIEYKKSRRFHTAIATFQHVIDVGASDKKLIPLSKKMMALCRAAIRNARNPLLKQAKEAEDGGDLVKAFALYQKATKVDPPHPVGHQGMKRIKGILHDRAKVIYTEAILAESYSDFATAKKMFQECLRIAPQDDIYYERAQRKLAHYFKKEEGPVQ